MSACARRALIAAVAVAATTVEAAPAAGPGGRWLLETRVLLPEGTALAGEPVRQCVGDDGVLAMPPGVPGAPCRVVARQRSGRRVRWLARCEGPGGPAELRGDVGWEAERMSGRLELRAPDGLLAMEVTGRRLGPCR